MHDIFEQTLALNRERLEGKSFCVRVKRRGKHSFSSQDVERYVGGGLNQHIESARVQLNHPDVTVNLEIEDDRLLLITGREDPDTLFFQRRLRMQGDTELGVYLKNFLASVDPASLPLGTLVQPALQRGLSVYERLA